MEYTADFWYLVWCPMRIERHSRPSSKEQLRFVVIITLQSKHGIWKPYGPSFNKTLPRRLHKLKMFILQHENLFVRSSNKRIRVSCFKPSAANPSKCPTLPPIYIIRQTHNRLQTDHKCSPTILSFDINLQSARVKYGGLAKSFSCCSLCVKFSVTISPRFVIWKGASIDGLQSPSCGKSLKSAGEGARSPLSE
jgi:hypothetical protein